MKLFLHIGTEKTGTTSIQSFGNINRERLRQNGVFYSQTLGHRNHRKLPFIASDPDVVDDFVKVSGLLNPKRRQAAKAEFFDEFLAELAMQDSCSTTIISSEHFHSRLSAPSEIQRLRDHLLPHFSEIVIVLYIREQIGYAVSSYTTHVKNGGQAQRIKRPEKLPIDYQALIQLWADNFPEANLQLRLFDRKELVGGDVVPDFCAVLGLDVAEYEVPERRNESLDLLSLELLRRINVSVPKFDEKALNPLRADIRRYFADHSSDCGKLDMPPKLQARYKDFFKDSNEWVRQRYFPEREALFTPRPEAKNKQVSTLSISAEELDAVAALISAIWIKKQNQINRSKNRQKDPDHA